MHHHGNSSLSSLGLSAGHTQELQSYLRFFRNKREVGIRQIEVEFEDILDRQLSLDKDNMYTYEEVSDTIHGVKKLIKEHVRQDISNIINMNVLLLKQILNEVEEKNVQYRKIYGVDGGDLDDDFEEVKMDISVIEDQNLIDEIERMNLNLSSGSGGTDREFLKANRLRSLKDDHNLLASKTKDVEKENQSLKSQLSLSKIKIEELEHDMEQRLNDCKAFQQLRKLMSSKNDELIALRQELANYKNGELGSTVARSNGSSSSSPNSNRIRTSRRKNDGDRDGGKSDDEED